MYPENYSNSSIGELFIKNHDEGERVVRDTCDKGGVRNQRDVTRTTIIILVSPGHKPRWPS